jgi:hypothetical protein
VSRGAVVAIALVAALAGAAVSGGIFSDRARDAEAARWRARLAEEAESSAAFRGRLAAALAQAESLRADSSRLYGRLAVATEAAAAGAGTIRHLLGQLRDTAAARRGAEALGDLERAGAECRETLGNCEQRVANAEGRALDALGRVGGLEAALDTTGRKWERAEREASRRWTLAVTGGYGATAGGGQVCTGPSIVAGASYRVRIRDLWPF